MLWFFLLLKGAAWLRAEAYFDEQPYTRSVRLAPNLVQGLGLRKQWKLGCVRSLVVSVLAMKTMDLVMFLTRLCWVCTRFVDSFKKKFAEQVRLVLSAVLHPEFLLACPSLLDYSFQEFTALKRRVSVQPGSYICLVAVIVSRTLFDVFISSHVSVVRW